MRSFIRRTLSELSRCSSGNATLLVALGMPVLIGGAGLGVDVTQWYMWKRELQFAADQGAIAGAWARSDTSTASTYQTRATQEFDANLSITEDISTTPVVTLANFGTGTNNSVVVTATATRSLPFSRILIDGGATISTRAQAVFVAGTSFTTCMLAVDPTASGAFTLGGSLSGSAPCGFGALSDDDEAMTKNGNSNARAGWLVSTGGIDQGYASNGTIHANAEGLRDPFAGLTPPDSPTLQEYYCPPVTPAIVTTTADVTTRVVTSYAYKKGSNSNNWSNYTYGQAKTSTTTTAGPTNGTVDNGVTAGSTTSTAQTATKISGNGQNSIWEVQSTTTTKTYANVISTTVGGSDGVARPQPGTYTSIVIACRTEFAPGVYQVTGTLDFGQNLTVIGSDMMFVLQSTNGMHINSNSNINLSGITAGTLVNSYSMTTADAAKLAGMLIYDVDSTDELRINGNSTVLLNGTVYVPRRHVQFNGNSSVSGACMMIAAGTITFTGNNHLGSFCVPAVAAGMNIGGTSAAVRLVA